MLIAQTKDVRAGHVFFVAFEQSTGEVVKELAKCKHIYNDWVKMCLRCMVDCQDVLVGCLVEEFLVPRQLVPLYRMAGHIGLQTWTN